MNTQDINKNNTAAPSVTIAPRSSGSQPSTINPQPVYVVTLTTHKDVRSYPCRSMESAVKLAERFIAGVTKPAKASAPSNTTPQPAPAPEPVAA
jgi:hypothetical protein